MRIVEINVTEFGCLKNKKIALSEGVNIITGSNESGKSTLMLFIKFMFYGLSRRSAKGVEKERALCWDSHRAAGTLTLERDGVRYLIERRASGSSRVSEECKITNLRTGEELRGDAAEIFLGVPCEVFESSCFISQMKASEINKAQASGAIENMLASADESIDVAGILDTIDKVRKEYKLNRGDGGILFETARQINALRSKHKDATEKYLLYNETNAKLSRTRARIEKVKLSHVATKNMLEDVNKARILRRFDELDAKKAVREQKVAELKALDQKLSNGAFVADRAHVASLRGGSNALSETLARLRLREREYGEIPHLSREEQALSAMGQRIAEIGGREAAISEIRAFDKKAASRRTAAAVLLPLGGVCAVGAAIAFALFSAYAGVGIAAVAAVSAIFGVTSVLGAGKAKKNRDALCGQYGVPFSEISDYFESCIRALDKKNELGEQTVAAQARLCSAREDAESAQQKLEALILRTQRDGALELPAEQRALAEADRLEKLCDSADELRRDVYAIDAIIDNASRELSEYDRAALAASVKTDVASLDAKKIESARTAERYDRERLEVLNREERELSDRIAALGAGLVDPMELSDRICELEKKLEADEAYYESLMMAKQYIERASEAMSSSVTPELCRRAGELIAQISDGAHTALQTTKGLDVSLEQGGFLVNESLLSGGTRDAAYVCLRISLMLRLFGAELPPILMDESFCQLDDTRASRLLALLARLSDTAQSLIFTCHGRELRIGEELGIDVNSVYL